MNKEKIFKIILMPHVTNKSVDITESSSSVVFKVVPYSSKKEIKIAVETLFKVKVNKVRTVNVKGKIRNFKKIKGKTKLWKKAYVRLDKGHSINFVGSD